jgi:MiaB/RimO family radical SAM methylthiotransferase
MNVNDAELVTGILCRPEHCYERVENVAEANVALLMTCSVREAAEDKAWKRLDWLASIQRKHGNLNTIGVLGCMAERLKLSVFEKRPFINLVCGPDSYRSLPILLESAGQGKKAVDVDLSMHETYEEELVDSVRNPLSKSAFVSIMRGCNNMCTFCIVPFTRGRERSRSVYSIEEEVKRLAESGIKEVTLLGQNVNSYNYVSEDEEYNKRDPIPPTYSLGFAPLFKPKVFGIRFPQLLERLANNFSNIRFRFTSPHPRDFPDELLGLMKSKSNIAKHIHLPLQSGNDAVLERMRRGYTHESYMNLVSKIRATIPGIAISTDVIAGFCGETEQEHQDTLKVFDTVAYDMAYMYAYSMREKTAAYRRYPDDVPDHVKQRRLAEIIDVFRRRNNDRLDTYLNTETTILVEGDSKKSEDYWTGRSSENSVVIIPKSSNSCGVGDFVRVRLIQRKGSTLIGEYLNASSSP